MLRQKRLAPGRCVSHQLLAPTDPTPTCEKLWGSRSACTVIARSAATKPKPRAAAWRDSIKFGGIASPPCGGSQ
jgi:hypothetical protein